MPAFHPPEEVLLEYAAGSLPEAISLVVATHLALCPQCRAAVAACEAVGGALIEELEPAEVCDGALESVLARLGEVAPPEARPEKIESIDLRLPQPLRGFVGVDLDSLPWRRVMPGLEEVDIDTGSSGMRARLMRVAAGKAMPSHTHGGEEFTLVLTGAYNDASGHYACGDVQVADPELDHQPVAEDGEPCVCLVVSDAPIKLTGRYGRLLNPFISYK